MLRDGPHWLPAWGGAAALLLVLQWGLGLGFGIALAAGLALGIALTLLLRPRSLAERVPAGTRGELVRRLIAEAEPPLAQLRAAAGAIRAPGIGVRFTHMAEAAEAVMQALAADPARIGQGQRLLTYLLPRAAQLAEGLRLVEAQAAPDPERQGRLAAMTARLETAFMRSRDSLAEPELRALDLELRLLEDALAETDAKKVAR
jgi:GNAT superfamily N-acetyltransferase